MRARRNFDIAGETAPSEVPTVDENMNVTRFVTRPDDLDVSDIPKPTQRIGDEIQPAPFICTGYRPSDLLLKKIALIAIRVVFESQHHLPAVDDPLRRRSNVLSATLLAEPQGVGKIRESFLQLRWRRVAVYRRFDLLLALTLREKVVRQTDVRTSFDVQNFRIEPIEELVLWLLDCLDHPVQRGRLQERHVPAHEANQSRLVGFYISRDDMAGRCGS